MPVNTMQQLRASQGAVGLTVVAQGGPTSGNGLRQNIHNGQSQCFYQ